MGMSQTSGTIPPKFDLAPNLQKDQVEREQNGQITPELQGGNWENKVQQGAAWPGAESCCYSKNASVRRGLAVPLVTPAPTAAGIYSCRRTYLNVESPWLMVGLRSPGGS